MSAPIFVPGRGPDRTLGILADPVRCPSCGVMAMLVIVRGASATCIPCSPKKTPVCGLEFNSFGHRCARAAGHAGPHQAP